MTPVDVTRASDAADEKRRLLEELAKLTKPTGASAQGRSEERPDDDPDAES